MAFYFAPAPALQAIAIGPAVAKVTRTPQKSNCSYSKTQAVNYIWHWACSTPFAQSQTLNGKWTFPIQVSGVKGTANLVWTFNYRVDSTPCVPGQPC